MVAGLLVGSAIGTIVTLAFTNKKFSKKIKEGTESLADNITSLFKIN